MVLQIVDDGFHCDTYADIPDASFVATAIKAATYVSLPLLYYAIVIRKSNTSHSQHPDTNRK